MRRKRSRKEQKPLFQRCEKWLKTRYRTAIIALLRCVIPEQERQFGTLRGGERG